MNRFMLIVTLVVVLSPSVRSQTDSLSVATLPPGARDTTTLNFKDTDIRDVFRAVSLQHKINIYVDNSVTKRITISLVRVTVYDAVKFICEQHGLNLQLEGGIFRIAPPPLPKVEPPPQKIPFVYYENGLLSVKLKSDNLEDVVLTIQERTGKNILVSGGTSGSLSGTLNDIEFDVGFTQLMNNNGFAIQKKNGIYIVSRLEYFVGQQGGQTQAQKSGPYWISVDDSLVTVEVTNAPLDRVINDLVRQSNADVMFYSQITGTTTARATHVTLSRALHLILRNTNYSYRVSDGIYFVGEKTNSALSATRLFRLKYLRSDKILETLPPSITSFAVLKVMKEHNGLVAVGPSDVIAQLEEYLDQIDQPVAQVLIEAIVVDFDLSRGLELGVDAGGVGKSDSTGVSGLPFSVIPGVNATFGGPQINKVLQEIGSVNLFGADLNVANLGRLSGDFYLNLKALEQKGIANIRSRPLIATINGHQASLSIGTTQYFILKTTTPYRDPSQVVFQESQNFQTIEADIKLEITPFVGSNGLITVDIKPDFRTPVGQLSPDIPPTINRRAMSSSVIMKQGETIMLGGLIQETESEHVSQVPLLGDIPFLGSVFSSTTKTTRKSELIIYVTPHISYGEAFQAASIIGQDRHTR